METQEQPILSVSELSLSLKSCVEQVFAHVRVRGEVSGLKTVASGHTYFSLKDKDSVLSAICWRGRSAASVLQEGLEVVCTGKLSTYPGRSNYQMIVESAAPAGIGALLKLLNERREKLAKEGLFDSAHKKKIPFLPATIGVITSPTGAVIRDIMHRLRDRFPRPVFLWPVLVQGDGAADQVVQAIQGFNAIPPAGLSTPDGLIPRPDVLIVARGGGSLEDLWCFNEETVVRAVYHSDIPIISAVGHETDTTLIDYVSDLRAPTPTGAAEKAVPVRSDLLTHLQTQTLRLTESLYRTLSDKKLKLDSLNLPNLGEVINNFLQRLDDRSERLDQAFSVYWRSINVRFETSAKLLKSLSYHSILERGFALISSPSHQVISQSTVAAAQKSLILSFADGQIEAIPTTPHTQHESPDLSFTQSPTSQVSSPAPTASSQTSVPTGKATNADTPAQAPDPLKKPISNAISASTPARKSTPGPIFTPAQPRVSTPAATDRTPDTPVKPDPATISDPAQPREFPQSAPVSHPNPTPAPYFQGDLFNEK